MRFIYLLLLFIWGCESNTLVEIESEGVNQGKILRFYLGSFASAETVDPIKAGILIQNGEKWQLDLAKLEIAYPNAKGKLQAEGGKIPFDVLKDFVSAQYYEARKFPVTLATFQQRYAYSNADAWMKVVINSAMTDLERTIYVEKSALKSALSQYKANRNQLLYPENTAIIGEHHENGVVVETTIMQKRADGFWDFWLYDAQGNLAKATLAKPKALKAPVQCVGCHFGKKLFEPEKSYPNPVTSSSDMLRKIHVTPSLQTTVMTAFFQEHEKRSDTILGIYNTLFITELLRKRDANQVTDEEKQILSVIE